MNFNAFTPPRNQGILRRNTIGTAGSPFNYRRPRALQSTPVGPATPRNFNDSSINLGPNVSIQRPPPLLEISDVSTIAPVGDMMEQKYAAERDRRPSIFGRENNENTALKKDAFGLMDGNVAMNANRFDAFKAPARPILKRSTPPSKEFLEAADELEDMQPALLFSGAKNRSTAQVEEKVVDAPLIRGKKGPPLRSIHSFEPAVKRTRPNSGTEAVAKSSDSESDASEDDYWVTIFGFDKNQRSSMLELFERHGNIIKHVAADEGNWMRLRYGSITHAQQALQRNGQMIDNYIIGVLPSTKPNGFAFSHSPPAIPGHNEKLSKTYGVKAVESLNDSVRSEKGFYPGMRACAAPGFKFNENKSDESIMSKIFNVFKG